MWWSVPRLSVLAPLVVAGCAGHVGPVLTEGTHAVELRDGRRVVHVRGAPRPGIAPVIVIAGGPGLEWSYLDLPSAIGPRTALMHLELLGTGASARLPDTNEYTRARDVADVEAVRSHFGVDEVVLVGHSYGGFVALEYALAHPERVAGLVLYDTAASSGPELWADIRANLQARADAPWFAGASAAFSGSPRAHDDASITANFRRAAPLYLHDYDADPTRWDAWFAHLHVSYARSHDGPAETFDVRARLGELRVPTLVIVGASDFVCSPAMARELASGIPGAEIVVLERSGHFGHVEEPDAFATAVNAFLDRLDAHE